MSRQASTNADRDAGETPLSLQKRRSEPSTWAVGTGRVSRRNPMRRSLAPIALVAALLASIGACADVGATSIETDASVGVDATPTNDAGLNVSDSGSGSNAAVSPLCKRPVENCALDAVTCLASVSDAGPRGDGSDAGVTDAATQRDVGALDASATDGSADADAGTDLAALRCTADARATSCEAAGTGADGDSCGRDSDCAAGFACTRAPGMAGAKGGQCRRYCCAGSCAADGTGKKFFCDVQAKTEGVLPAPVCMPVRPCRLLQQGACEAAETCSPVIQGSRSCVAVGTATEGMSCDEDHCADGFVCLGAPGARKCKRLCHDGLRPCPTGAQCVGGYPYFDEEGFGVCTTGLVAGK